MGGGGEPVKKIMQHYDRGGGSPLKYTFGSIKSTFIAVTAPRNIAYPRMCPRIGRVRGLRSPNNFLMHFSAANSFKRIFIWQDDKF